MDFLNQFPNSTKDKDDNSLFSFTDKTEQKDLPFAFGTQSSEAGEISFLNQMKSQDQGESFALDNSQKNAGGLNFLKTIYEVPESSNNIFNSESGFPLQSVQMGLDFIREGNEDTLNFDSFQNKHHSGDGEMINVDINNLFKNSASPPLNNNSKPESKNENENKKMNKNLSIELSAKKGENVNNKNINEINDNINMNINKIPSNQNKNINITPEIRSNPTINPRQTRPSNNNTNNIPVKLLNNNNNNIFNGDNMNNNIAENSNNIIPQQFQNISIKPQTIKEPKNNNLDDIDKMISMNLKPENKQVNKNIINTNTIPNEISDIFSSSSMKGKRANLEPKDKDLKNIDNLLNFTKEPMPYPSMINNKQKPLIMSNPSINSNNTNNINNNTNAQFIKKKTQGSNNIMIKPLPGDSFDKKSQVINLTKNEMTNLSQMDSSNKDKNGVPSKLDMIQKYNDLANRLNKIREQAKEYRNLGNYFSQLISANENYEFVYPNVIRKLLEDYSKMSEILLRFVKIKNNKMNEMSNEFDEEVRKYSLTFSEQI